MGFLSGSMTFERYWITSDPTPELGESHIKTLEKFSIEKQQTSALEEPNIGFIAGSHLLDVNFSLAKNVIGDALHFAVRIDTDQIPAAVRNAWLQMELLPLTVDNPSGKPTKAQREEARELVEARCAEEAATGKFRRMQQASLLWDTSNDEIYVGSTSPTVREACVELLQRAFDLEVEHVGSGRLAMTYATEYEQLEALYGLSPAAFVDRDGPSGVNWWNGMSDNYDYLGNEFLLWLWWRWETQGDMIQLSDDSKVCGMFARTLALDCPVGETGKETISADSPVMLPEAALAIRSGKLPRKAGLTLVRHDQQYDLTLQAETFAVNGAKITQIGNDNAVDGQDRIQQLREFSETMDLLFDVFCERRLGKGWKADLKNIQQWLQTDKPIRRRAAAA